MLTFQGRGDDLRKFLKSRKIFLEEPIMKHK
jgi:hypothetical protein